VFGLDSGIASCREEAFQAFMPKASNHDCKCNPCRYAATIKLN